MDLPSYTARYSPHPLFMQRFEDASHVSREQELSIETNRRRRLLSERKRQLLLLEQERINATLKQRGGVRYHVRTDSSVRHEAGSQPVRGDFIINVNGSSLGGEGDVTARSSVSSGVNVARDRQTESYLRMYAASSGPPSSRLDVIASTFGLRHNTSSGVSRLRRSASLDMVIPTQLYANKPVQDSADLQTAASHFYRRVFASTDRSEQARPRDRAGSEVADDARRVHMTNNHIVMSKYGVLPTGDAANQEEERFAARSASTVTGYEPTSHSYSTKQASADSSDRVDTLEERTRALQNELGRLSQVDSQLNQATLPYAATGRDSTDSTSYQQDSNLNTPLTSSRDQPLLSLRRRGSVGELHRDAVAGVGNGTKAGNGRSKAAKIRGILKRSSSIDSLAQLAPEAADSSRNLTSRIASANSSYGKSFDSVDENGTKKSVRFAESNSTGHADDAASQDRAARTRTPANFAQTLESPRSAHVTLRPPAHPYSSRLSSALLTSRMTLAQQSSGDAMDRDGFASTPSDGQMNASWATDRDYPPNSALAPTFHNSTLAAQQRRSAPNTAQTVAAKFNQTSVVDNNAMLGLAGPQVRAMRSINAAPNGALQLQGQMIVPRSTYSFSHADLQSGVAPNIRPSLMHPGVNTNLNVRRKSLAVAANGRHEPQKGSEDVLLQLTRQFALQKQKQPANPNNGSLHLVRAELTNR